MTEDDAIRREQELLIRSLLEQRDRLRAEVRQLRRQLLDVAVDRSRR